MKNSRNFRNFLRDKGEKFLRDERGGIMDAIITVPITILFLLISFSMLDPILQSTFNVLNNAQAGGALSYVPVIKLILGMIGLVMAIYTLLAIINEFRTRDEPQYISP